MGSSRADREPTEETREDAVQAMVLKKLGAALEWTDLADRQPGPGEIRVKVAACGVCRTDLHVVDGELADPHVPIIPGHEIVGRIDAIGAGVNGLHMGERGFFLTLCDSRLIERASFERVTERHRRGHTWIV